MHHRILFSHTPTMIQLRTLLLSAFVLPSQILLFAAPTPELTALQQQYAVALAERVTSPYDRAVDELNAKYAGALDSAATQAKGSGDLPTLLAIQADKKLLTEKQPLPEDDDKTPEALKKLRSIYRGQFSKITEQRTSNAAALLTPYAVKLKELEARLTKADRIAEAQEVLTYREGLKADVLPAAAPVAASKSVEPATPTMKDAPASTAKAGTKLPKGDARAAAEWVLGIGGQIMLLSDGEKRTISKIEDLPPRRLGAYGILLDGNQGNVKTVTDTDMNRFAGQEELQEVILRGISLTESGIRFMGTCPNITLVNLGDIRINENWMAHFKGLRQLQTLEITGKTGYQGQGLEQLALLPIENLRLYRSNLNDQGLAAIKDYKAVKALNLEDTEVTDAGLADLAGLSQLKALNAGVTQVTAQGLEHLKGIDLDQFGFGKSNESLTSDLPRAGKLFPNVTYFLLPRNLSYGAQDIALLGRTFPKLNNILTYSLDFGDDACAGLVEVPGLTNLSIINAGKITDAGLASIAKLKSLQSLTLQGCQMTDRGLELFLGRKSLKNLFIHSAPVTDAGLAAFKKERPDVRVEK